jgi:hypothetical protein
MANPRRKLGAAGLCLAIVLSLTALSAPTANANWKVGGAEIKEGTEVPLALTVHLKFKFLIRIPFLGLNIHCDRVLIHGRLRFPRFWRSRFLIDVNCRILIGEKESAVCKLTEPVEAPTEAELFLHEGQTYLRVKPETGETLMTLKISGEECALPKEFPIKGSFVLEDPTLEKESVEQVFTPNNKGLFADKLTSGKNEVLLEGEMGITLGEGFEGKAWSGTI